MSDAIHTTELASDAEIAEIRALAASRGVMHWPALLRVINRLETAERERNDERGKLAAVLKEAAGLAMPILRRNGHLKEAEELRAFVERAP
jgi:hypothetical protein